ncbi:MAG TPA: thrombospondin type 3 repeat-containing protein [Candidatus Gracilibacteria bacterium]
MVGKNVAVQLEPQEVQLISRSFDNVQLVDQNNDPVAFEIYDRKPEKIKEDLTIFDVSSQKEGDPTYLFDNDILSVYSFDKKKDGTGPASVLLDLGSIQWVNRINMFYSDRNTLRTYEIESGLTMDKIRTVKARSAMEQTVEFLTPRAMRYVRFKWWGPQIKIDDINLFASPQASLYFAPKASQTYRVLFGNPKLKSVRYKARYSIAKKEIPFLESSRMEINQLLPEDFDGDGIPNIEDNCLTIKNKTQKDTDQDLVGDDCDNALENKNRYQYDTDWDNIGDIIDNCKFDYNPDQKDRDNDGIGDACDNAHAKESVLNVRTKPYFFYGIFIVLVIGVGAMFIIEKFKKKPEEK